MSITVNVKLSDQENALLLRYSKKLGITKRAYARTAISTSLTIDYKDEVKNSDTSPTKFSNDIKNRH